jgi:hypothetical protein
LICRLTIFILHRRLYRANFLNCVDNVNGVFTTGVSLCSLVSGTSPPVITSSGVNVTQSATSWQVLEVLSSSPILSAGWFRRVAGGTTWTALSGAYFNATEKRTTWNASAVGLFGTHEYYAKVVNCAGYTNSSSFFVCSGSVPNIAANPVVANVSVGLGVLANFRFCLFVLFF